MEKKPIRRAKAKSAQMLGIGGDGQQSLRAGLEQQIVENPLVLQCQRVELLRSGENQMKVLDGQQVGLALLHPLGPFGLLAFRAMAIPARVVADALLVALRAALDMSAENGSAADLDSLHDPKLQQGQTMPQPELLAKPAEDVGHFERGPGHDRP